MNRRTFLSQSSQLLAVAGLAPHLFGENPMPEYNQRRALSFSNHWIESLLVNTVRDMEVEDAIVVNLSTAALRYRAGAEHGTIPPWKSSMLRRCTIESAEAAALLHVRQRTNLGGVALAWDWYGQRNPQFPRGTPLYISSQDDIGQVELDPLAFGHTGAGSSPRRYQLKLNLWYTPEETDCGIHTGHKFLEVHTQILGTGHMQKFRENNAATLYEDVLMPPGFTHDPFFAVAEDRSFSYPWHRYYADTDCIWMAIELHPAANPS
ncbi:MAG: hypothetical protein WCB59_03675 [Candidatus Sulfotelmatobacter sp.]